MSDVTAQASKTIAAPAAMIWKALTTPELTKHYFFGADVESDFRVGSPIYWRGEFKGQKYEDKGEVLEVLPDQRLRVSHWSPLSGTADTPENHHVVTFELSPQGGSTRVTVTQSNLAGGVKPSDIEKRQEYEKNWAMLLDGLEKLVASR